MIGPMISLSRILTGQRHAPVVYFARMGSTVKIGTTVNLGKRMEAMYVRLENVLLVTPGGRAEEKAWHKRFEACQILGSSRRELFRLEGDLEKFLRLDLGLRVEELSVNVQAASVPSDDVAGHVTLAEAVSSGLIKTSITNARQLRFRRRHSLNDMPLLVGKRGTADVFDPVALADWWGMREARRLTEKEAA